MTTSDATSYIPQFVNVWYGNVRLSEYEEKIGSECLFRCHLHQFRLCGANYTHIRVFRFKYVQQYGLFLKGDKMHILRMIVPPAALLK